MKYRLPQMAVRAKDSSISRTQTTMQRISILENFRPEYHGRKDQGDQDGAGGFQAADQAGLFAHFRAPGLLCQADIPVLPLDIGNIPQGQRHRVGNPVADTDAAEGGGELAGVGGADKQQHDGNGAGVFQDYIQVVEQLLRRDHIGPRDLKQHRPAPI